jgi:hypothetical protein
LDEVGPVRAVFDACLLFRRIEHHRRDNEGKHDHQARSDHYFDKCEARLSGSIELDAHSLKLDYNWGKVKPERNSPLLEEGLVLSPDETGLKTMDESVKLKPSRLIPAFNERGSAILQVVIIGSVVVIMAFFMAQFMTKSDREGMRIIHRNDNMNIATSLSDFVADHAQVSGSANVVDQVGGVPQVYP